MNVQKKPGVRDEYYCVIQYICKPTMVGKFQALDYGVFGQWTERESHIYLYFISSHDQQHTLLKVSDPLHYQSYKII